MPMRAIYDTNVFVAAGFNPRSASAQLLEAARDGRVTLVWDAATRREIRHVLARIPGLSWEMAADLFRADEEFTGRCDPALVSFVTDPQDRKFAALARATGATLVSADHHLLDHRDRLDVAKPSEVLRMRL
jgi:predicted nucleic acid-binding protein